jgi:hypothetical protein
MEDNGVSIFEKEPQSDRIERASFFKINNIIIIIINPPQSTAGHRPLQLLTISLDLRLLASSSFQPSCTNRHFTWPEGVLH